MVKRDNLLLSLDQLQRDSANSDEEFDFSDVFGPVHHQSDEYQPDEVLRSSKSTSMDAMAFASWAPLDSVAKGQPLVIHNRCHSMVGPTYGLPASLGRLPGMFEALQMRIDPKEGRALSDASAKVRPSLQILEENVPAAMGSLKPSAGPISKLCPQDFELLRVVGQGAFGKVFQVEKKDTGEILAMKVMSKSKIMEKNHEEYMKAERDILTKAIHPFIVQLHYSFQTKSKLYLIMDFINGGHLFFQLYRKGTFNEELARIYTAEIVMAVVHLHNLGIMHRDLKPENILLDSDGHVKITDFGLSKEVTDSDVSNSLCGTVEYMAPEIILAKGHGKGADWWSVGILLYEMLTGQPPFSHKNRQKLQQKIVKEKVKIPTYLTTEASSLLKGLLQKDPEKRLGHGPDGGEAIKKHKWFKAINWKKLEQKEIHPKFVPTVNGKHCIANFDEKWTTMPVHDSPAGTPTLGGIDIVEFKGYSYAAPRHYLPTVDSDDNDEDDDCGSSASDCSLDDNE